MKLKIWHWGLVGSTALMMFGCASSQPIEDRSRAELIEDIHIVEPIEQAEAPAPAPVEPIIIEKKVYIDRPVPAVPVVEPAVVAAPKQKPAPAGMTVDNACMERHYAAVQKHREHYIKAGAKKARAANVRTSGYGAPPKKFYPDAQRRLLAMRAAKVDAYRALAERIKGLHIWGGTTVGDMVVERDRFQVFVDATLEGARVISNHEQEDGSFETVLEVQIGQQFLQSVLPAPAVPKFPSECFGQNQPAVMSMAPASGEKKEVIASVTPMPEEEVPVISNDMQIKSPGFYYSE